MYNKFSKKSLGEPIIKKLKKEKIKKKKYCNGVLLDTILYTSYSLDKFIILKNKIVICFFFYECK